MSFGDLVSTPEAHYIGMPIAVSFLALAVGAFSRPRFHKAPSKRDFQLGLGWNLTAIVIWSSEAAIAARTNTPVTWAWWTPLALVLLLAVSGYYVLEYGWERETKGEEKGKLKNPLQVQGIIFPLFLGALSLLILYIQTR